MSSIELKTEIPGPRSRALMARREEAVARGPYHATPLFIESAEGALLHDVDGNTLLDFAGGLGCVNVGHRNAGVTAAAIAQVQKVVHTCTHVALTEPYLELCEALNRITPGTFAKKSVLLSSGAEAVENAVKIARAATGRTAIVAFGEAFHGRTLLAMTLTYKQVPYKQGFGPFAPDVFRIPYPNAYRCPHGVNDAGCGEACAAALETDLAQALGERNLDEVAAVIIEPVLGEGGFAAAPPAYLSRLREICTAHGILFIADEVQTGFGRTAKMFAVEHSGVVPDLMVMAKSMAAGFPLSAVTGRAELMDAPIVGGLGGTYGGNPVACAAALAVIRELETGPLLKRAEAIAETVGARFAQFRERHAVVGDARGLGAMRALELVADRDKRTPSADAAKALLKYATEHGLVTILAGTHGNVMRALMPLVITDAQLHEGLDVLDQGLATLTS